MRRSDKKVNSILKRQIQGTLSQTLVDLKTTDDANKFLTNFLTSSEFEMLAKRLAIGYWLKKGRSYGNIKENLKVSSATIASVQSLIETPGFQLALKNLEAEEWANQWSEKIKKFVGK